MERTIRRLCLAALLPVSVAAVATTHLATQRSVDRGVTVAVTPRNLAANAQDWEFAVVLDTHSQDLQDDLARSVVLIDSRSNRHPPLAWEGTAPGGHHREGVLRFRVISPVPDSIELRIERPGEPSARSFRWTLP